MHNIKKLNEEIKKVLQPIYEMSKAFSYKNRRIDVCAWVEGPMSVDNQYFKYYNNSSPDMATKVARIRIDRPEYVGGNHRELNIEKWKLSSSDKKELIEILKTNSKNYPNLTKWHDIILTYNYDNLDISYQDTIEGRLDDSNRSPRMPKHIKPLSIDTPIPNYLELEE